MSVIIIPRKHRRQPHGRAALNVSNPLAQNVVTAISFSNEMRDVVYGNALTLYSAGSLSPMYSGTALKSTGAAAAASIPVDLSAYNKITVSFLLYWDTYSNNDNICMEYGTNFVPDSGFFVDPSSGAPAAGRFQLGVGSPTQANAVSIVRPSAAEWHQYTMTFDRTAGAGKCSRVFVDGVEVDTVQNASGTVVGNFAASTLYIFSRANTSLFAAGSIQNIVIRGYLMTPEEAFAEWENPWQIFRADPLRIYSFPSGPITPTITGITASLVTSSSATITLGLTR